MKSIQRFGLYANVVVVKLSILANGFMGITPKELGETVIFINMDGDVTNFILFGLI